MPPSPTQLVWRARIEAVLRVAAPGLDLLLAAGDRLARAVGEGGPSSTGGVIAPPRSEALPARRAVGPGPAGDAA